MKLFSSKRGYALLLCLAVVFVGLLTWVIFLNRAGGALGNNWPVSWDLSNSDNGVLFQLSQDVFKGRHLDWSFSPQVYIFPEVPISLVSYALAAGSVYSYYIWVAIINNVLLFLVLFALVKAIFKVSTRRSLATALLASLPLLLFPLLSTNNLFDYQLAPTYYYGAYLFAFAAPLIYLAQRRWTKISLGAAYALTAASNPLLLVFTIPAALLVAAFKFFRDGFFSVFKFGASLAGLVLLSEAIRLIFFKNMVGTSPSNYIGIDRFAKRLHWIKNLLGHGFSTKYDHMILTLCLLAFAACGVLALRTARKYFVAKNADSENLALLYFNLVPLTALLALYLLMVINSLYLWMIIVAPLIILLMQGVRYAKPLAGSGLLVLIILLLLPKSISRTAHTQNYFSYKPALTVCLDKKLAPNQNVGYATFSDARKTELTSSHHILLIQILKLANPNGWLTNKGYATDYPGSFFVINPHGDETPIDSNRVVSLFGDPDKTLTCPGGIQVLSYSNPGALNKISTFYKQQTLEHK